MSKMSKRMIMNHKLKRKKSQRRKKNNKMLKKSMMFMKVMRNISKLQ